MANQSTIHISKHIINREISWLHFNERVLQEASDPATPLIERIKFLGIFSSNRDEFFRVRVASLNRMLNITGGIKVGDDDPREVLSQIKEIVAEQERIFTQTYFKIVEELGKHDIHMINETQLDEDQISFITNYYRDELRQYIFPIMLDSFQNLTSLKDGSIYLAIELKTSDGSVEETYALIKVPQKSVSRFVILPQKGNKHYIILLDDVIRYCLRFIFTKFGYDQFNAYTIKITRDAELDIDDDVSKSFLEKMSDSLKQRKRGVPVRFVYDANIPRKLLKKITKKLKISNDDNMRSGGRYHNFKDFMSFPKVGPPELFYPPFPKLEHKDIPRYQSIIALLKEKDIMLHFPYQSFHYIIDFLRESSIDPQVSEIKMTFYRAAKYSNVVNALVNAARNGKRVTVFLEIQARFDEEANITLAGKLHDEGVKIVPTIPGYKVHSKLILVKRREEEQDVFYANISTGNYNESTANVYVDNSLLTANQEITREVDLVFQLFEARFVPPTFKHLVVSPFHTRNFFFRMLDHEIQNARNGKDAWAIFKLNSIVDKKMVRKLYQASQAGVKIRMVVRGICVLIPGVKDVSENIEVISIVDRFLEHSRIFIFCNNNENLYYTGSADWMPRNLDHRIEVLTPINDKDIQQELWDIVQIQLNDNCKARISGEDFVNRYRKTDSTKPVRAQFEIYDYFKQKRIENS
ncbi:MAG TPA: polyphosphate kinase 1 [Bacteroidales bacterium]|nr:polyphosphate kinase 1 [Bacteroidales bacterium]HRX97613.1 polyphosphate kinase 1 [Bacteroidales bacterium]